MRSIESGRLSFQLPPRLEAHEPPEARGLARDEVRLMVSYRDTGELVHAAFKDLPRFLEKGTLLVANSSATLPAAVDAIGADGSPKVLHFSTRLPGSTDDGRWVVEVRQPANMASIRYSGARSGESLLLPGGATVRLVATYPPASSETSRLWAAEVTAPQPVVAYLKRFGQPIHYAHVPASWPLSAYQTVFARESGSAEMPSAARPFSTRVLAGLKDAGVEIALVHLDAGVSSLEAGESPFPEWFEVSAWAANRINDARDQGRPVIAVGTTSVRAVESSLDGAGRLKESAGWTDLVITPERGVRAIDGLITGWHQPEASHLMMLEAIEGRTLLEAAYADALRVGYLWHEFGDSQLVLTASA